MNDKQTQTAIRLSDSLLARIDKIAERMSQPGISPVTRAEVHRLAVERGVEHLEQAVKLMPRARAKR